MVEEKSIVEELNNMSEKEQIKLLLEKAKEYEWEIQMEDKKNFHINMRNIQLKRTEYLNYWNEKIISWTIWTGTKRISGKYGDMIYQFLELIKDK